VSPVLASILYSWFDHIIKKQVWTSLSRSVNIDDNCVIDAFHFSTCVYQMCFNERECV